MEVGGEDGRRRKRRRKTKEGIGTARGEKEHKLKVDQTAQESDDVMTKEEEPQDLGTFFQVGWDYLHGSLSSASL